MAKNGGWRETAADLHELYENLPQPEVAAVHQEKDEHDRDAELQRQLPLRPVAGPLPWSTLQCCAGACGRRRKTPVAVMFNMTVAMVMIMMTIHYLPSTGLHDCHLDGHDCAGGSLSTLASHCWMNVNTLSDGQLQLPPLQPLLLLPALLTARAADVPVVSTNYYRGVVEAAAATAPPEAMMAVGGSVDYADDHGAEDSMKECRGSRGAATTSKDERFGVVDMPGSAEGLSEEDKIERLLAWLRGAGLPEAGTAAIPFAVHIAYPASPSQLSATATTDREAACATGTTAAATSSAATVDDGSSSSASAAAAAADGGAMSSSGHMPKSRPDIGLRATRDIEEGEVLIRIPRSLHIRDSTLASQGVAPYQLTANDVATSGGWAQHTVLAAWLLQERAKGKDSEWYHFLQTLPSYVPLPMLFNEELLQYAEDAAFTELVKGHKVALENEYRRCDRTKIANASLSEFFWAVSMVCSRTFSDYSANSNGSGNDDGGISSIFNPATVMIPFVDFLNHDRNYNALWRFTEDGDYEITALRDIQEGEELFTHYGPKSTSMYLLGYGFIPKDNPTNVVMIFESMNAAAKYFTENKEEDLWKAWGVEGLPIMEQYVNRAVKNAMSGIEFDGYTRAQLPPDDSIHVNGFNYIEPRLLALWASIWYKSFHKEGPNYDVLAKACVLVGYNEEDNHLERGLDSNLMNALTFSVDFAIETIESLLAPSKSSLEESTHLQFHTNVKKSWEDESCNSHVIEDGQEVGLLLELKSERYKLLSRVLERLEAVAASLRRST